MFKEAIAVYKPIGISSHRVAIRLAESLGTPVTHTGSLDPMAEGVLVLLIGPEAKKAQIDLQAADKEYEFDVLFGFSTDSYDALGLVTGAAPYDPDDFQDQNLERALTGLPGHHQQEVPPFSSIVVRGRPLFWWAREGRLDEVGLPVRKIDIQKANLVCLNRTGKRDLEDRIRTNIGRVEGDFRQLRILESWRSALARHPNDRFLVATVRMTVGSGTYIRSIAHELGKGLGFPSLALRIIRIRNGRFDLAGCRTLREGVFF
jgi:tRNA pseudouridine55 synthase